MNETRGLWRGKRLDNQEWAEGYYVSNGENLHYIITDKFVQYLVDPSTLGECTGLRDKNKKLIFEGYILQFCNEDSEFTNYEVVWFGTAWKVIFAGDTEIGDDLDLFLCEHSIIIGNIHDTPELLKGAD